MDPDANLREIREIVARILSGNDQDGEVYRLAELIDALDEWMSGGSMGPDAWIR